MVLLLQLSTSSSAACVLGLSHSRRRRSNGGLLLGARVVASESVRTVTGDEEKVELGASGVKVTRLGIGAWAWGDTAYWNDFGWDDRKLKAAKAAFDVSIDGGITFFDTAEVYGAPIMGDVSSETLLGSFIKERQKTGPVEVVVATKFAALPWRFGRGSVLSALENSLSRLGLSSVDLYQLHWPGIWGNEGYIDGLGDAVEKGLVKAVGVSNYSEKRLRDAYDRLKKRGIPLASNQVNYSLIYRNPEQNGVKAACDELGITLIAYSPIAQDIVEVGTIWSRWGRECDYRGDRSLLFRLIDDAIGASVALEGRKFSKNTRGGSTISFNSEIATYTQHGNSVRGSRTLRDEDFDLDNIEDDNEIIPNDNEDVENVFGFTSSPPPTYASAQEGNIVDKFDELSRLYLI